MNSRVTPLRLLGCIALVALWSNTNVASACDHSRTTAANAAGKTCPASLCAKTSCPHATSATMATAVKPAAKSRSASAFAPLPSKMAPAATTAFPALPTFMQPSPIVAGLMAFIDPETGLLTGPTAELSVPGDVAAQIAAPVELTPVTMPDGSVMIDLQGTLQDYYVLHIDPLGRRTVQCVQSPRQAQALPAAPLLLPIAER